MPDDKELSEILNRIVSREASCEGGWAEYALNEDNIKFGNPLNNQDELKQALLAWRERYAEEARADELQRIDTANKDNDINFWFEDMSEKNNGWRTMRQYVPERLKQLSKGGK